MGAMGRLISRCLICRVALRCIRDPGPGLTTRSLGESGGQESVTLTLNEIPSHTHQLLAGGTATDTVPSGKVLGQPSAKTYGPPGNPLALSAAAIGQVGGQPHDNRQPYLTVNFIIALQGVFPSRP